MNETTSNMCSCIKQRIDMRQCPECLGLIYNLPVLTEEIERLTTEGKIMFDALTHIDDVADALDEAEHIARTALSMVADVRSDSASGRQNRG